MTLQLTSASDVPFGIDNILALLYNRLKILKSILVDDY